jgi:hypothetical protein
LKHLIENVYSQTGFSDLYRRVKEVDREEFLLESPNIKEVKLNGDKSEDGGKKNQVT